MTLSKKSRSLLTELEIDLKDPLTAIRFVAEEVKKTHKRDRFLKYYMEVITKETRRVLEILQAVKSENRKTSKGSIGKARRASAQSTSEP